MRTPLSDEEDLVRLRAFFDSMRKNPYIFTLDGVRCRCCMMISCLSSETGGLYEPIHTESCPVVSFVSVPS